MSSVSFLRISNHLEYSCTGNGPFLLTFRCRLWRRVCCLEWRRRRWLGFRVLVAGPLLHRKVMCLNRGQPYATCFSLQVDCERKITLATIGKIDVTSGNKNPPFCIISFFLAECLTRLSASRRSANLYFCSLRFRQVDSGTFPTKTFKTHSFILLIKSLPPAEIIALLNFGFALFNRCRVW